MKSFTVSESLLRELGDMRRQVDLLIAQQQSMAGTTPYFRKYVAKLSGSMSAGSDSGGTRTPGSGTLVLQRRNVSGELEAITDGVGADVTITAYNWTAATPTDDAYMFVVQDCLGTWWVVAEAC